MAKKHKASKSLIDSINTTKEYEVTYYIPSLTDADEEGCMKDRTFPGVSKSDVETKFYDWLESDECTLPEKDRVYHISIDKVRRTG